MALPNLIANDLVIVSPMSSMSGYITYINYTAGSNKGNVKKGDIFNNPFMLGDVDGNDPTTGVGNGHTANYTAARVVESFTLKAAGANSGITVGGTEVASTALIGVAAWFPVYNGDAAQCTCTGGSDPAGQDGPRYDHEHEGTIRRCCEAH